MKYVLLIISSISLLAIFILIFSIYSRLKKLLQDVANQKARIERIEKRKGLDICLCCENVLHCKNAPINNECMFFKEIEIENKIPQGFGIPVEYVGV